MSKTKTDELRRLLQQDIDQATKERWALQFQLDQLEQEYRQRAAALQQQMQHCDDVIREREAALNPSAEKGK